MTTTTQPDVWSRLARTFGHLFGFILRLLFVLLLAVGLGAGIYYGLPWVYRTLVEPVQSNRTQIASVSRDLENFRTRIGAAQVVQDERLTTLETNDDARREQAAAADSALAGLQAALQEETAARAALETQLAAQQTASRQLAGDVAAIESSLAEFDVVRAELAALNQQLALARLQNRLLRARVLVLAENLGEARTLLETAAESMLAFVEANSALPGDTRTVLASRLTTALGLVAAQPGAALVELESIQLQLESALQPAAPAGSP